MASLVIALATMSLVITIAQRVIMGNVLIRRGAITHRRAYMLAELFFTLSELFKGAMVSVVRLILLSFFFGARRARRSRALRMNVLLFAGLTFTRSDVSQLPPDAAHWDPAAHAFNAVLKLELLHSSPLKNSAEWAWLTRLKSARALAKLRRRRLRGKSRVAPYSGSAAAGGPQATDGDELLARGEVGDAWGSDSDSSDLDVGEPPSSGPHRGARIVEMAQRDHSGGVHAHRRTGNLEDRDPQADLAAGSRSKRARARWHLAWLLHSQPAVKPFQHTEEHRYNVSAWDRAHLPWRHAPHRETTPPGKLPGDKQSATRLPDALPGWGLADETEFWLHDSSRPLHVLGQTRRSMYRSARPDGLQRYWLLVRVACHRGVALALDNAAARWRLWTRALARAAVSVQAWRRMVCGKAGST